MVSLPAFLLAVALSGNGDTVLLDFSADWCVPCRQMEPTIDRLRDAGYPVRRVDVDQNPDLARQFGVRPIPCFVLVRDGREVDRVVGAASFDRLVQMFGGRRPASAPSDGPILRGQSPDISPPSQLPPAQLSPARLSPAQLPPSQRSPAPTTAGSDWGSAPIAADAAQGAPSAADAVHRRALAATVRLTVSDATGRSHGTGTIIDSHGDEALIVTCGHIFRDSQGQGQIMVELFTPGAQGAVPGQLIAYEADDRDIGLVAIRPGVPVQSVPIGSTDYRPQKGEPVFSIGCDHGADPTVRVSSISMVDRYVGPPNLEIHGHPVQGRSGGGLFNEDGHLIGVCNAADLQEDRGIYAALATVYLELKQIGQERIYLDQQGAPRQPVDPGVNSHLATPTLPVSAPAAVPPLSAGEAGMEMICIVRPRDQRDGESRVLVVDHPSAELLARLGREAQATAPSAIPATGLPTVDAALRRRPPSATEPVVRAQGN